MGLPRFTPASKAMTKHERLLWSLAHAQPRSLAHTWAEREGFFCVVCGAVGASLLTSCPGHLLNGSALSSIRKRQVLDLALEKYKRTLPQGRCTE